MGSAFLLVALLAPGCDDDRNEPPPPTGLTRTVLGFYPYWTPPNEYEQFRFDLLSTLVWSSLQPNPDGTVDTSRFGWPPTDLIATAQTRQVKVLVSIGATDAARIDDILADPTKQATLANAILSLLQTHGLDGVDIDFEGVNATNGITAGSNRPLLVDLMTAISQTLWTAQPSYKINIDLPDKDWVNVWDVAQLNARCTTLMIMGYDIFWSGSAYAGPPGPLNADNPADPNDWCVTKAVDVYLAAGAAKQKLLLGVPYYGYVYPTTDGSRLSPTQGPGVPYRYVDMASWASTYGRIWDLTWETPAFAYDNAGQWYQGHFEDAQSLARKYDLAIDRDIAGIGIWALAYDSGAPALWNAIEAKFAR
ncbi:MAG: hypothetical protein HYY16_19080 [Planctomycetes bacterium]|nr:hypothetical protein [Planctomycetota bacterium]